MVFFSVLLVLLPAAKTQGKSESATTPLLLPSQQHPARLGVVEPRLDPLPLDVGASPAQLLPQPPVHALSKKTAAAAITFQVMLGAVVTHCMLAKRWDF